MRLLLLLALAWPAAGAPLDDWLGALGEAEVVVLAPSLERVAAPLAKANAALRSQPALTEWLDLVLAVLPFDTLDPKVHGARGLQASGPLLFATLPTGWVAVVGARTRDEGLRWLDSSNLAVGHHAWRAGAFYFGSAPELVDKLMDGKGQARPLSDCPRKKGQAELFVRAFRMCATLRFDPDRVRLDVRARKLPGGLKVGKADAIFPRLGKGITAALATDLGPALMRRLAPKAPLLELLDGRLGVAAGPEPTQASLMVGLAVPIEKAEATLSKELQAANGRPVGDKTLKVKAEAGRRWALEIPGEGKAWVGLRDGWLYATTRQSVADGAAGDLRKGLGGPGRLDPKLLTGVAGALYLRLTGVPHDGTPWLMPLLPHLKLLQLPDAGLRSILRAAAFVAAHISELGVGMRESAAGSELSVEVVLL